MSPTTIKAAIIVAICAALLGIGAWGGTEYTKSKWNKQKAADSEAALAMTIEYANEIVRRDEEHDTRQAIIDNLSYRIRDRVRVKFPACPPTTTADKDGRSGAFSERVDEIYSNHAERAGRIVKRCDDLNIDAIRSNGIIQ